MAEDPFLDRLSDTARAALARAYVLREVPTNGTVISEDDSTSDAFIVLSGRARATSYSDEGKMVAYRDIGPGEIFGELAAIDGAPRSASVAALEPLEVGVLTEARFRQLIEETPDFAWAVLKHLAAQSRMMTERIYEYSTMLVRERLIAELIRMFADAPSTHAGGPGDAREIAPSPTHFELAARISTHREAVSREMSKFSKMGLVIRRDGSLIVTDLDGLRAMRPDALD